MKLSIEALEMDRPTAVLLKKISDLIIESLPEASSLEASSPEENSSKIAAPPVKEKAAEAPPVEEKKETPANKKADAPAAEKKVTFDDIKALVIKLAQAKKKEIVKDILLEFNASGISDLEEKYYADVYARLQEVS